MSRERGVSAALDLQLQLLLPLLLVSMYMYNLSSIVYRGFMY